MALVFDVRGIVEEVRKYAADAAALPKRCEALSLCLEHNPATSAEASRCGAVEAVLSALSLHAADAVVQRAGWQVVQRLVALAEAVPRARSAGAVVQAIAALRAHPDHAAVQVLCMCALRNMLVVDGSAVAQARCAGAVDVAVAAWRLHASQVNDGHCCEVLHLVAEHEPWIAQQACIAGALDLVLAALQAHRHSSKAVSVALWLLPDLLPFSPDAQRAAIVELILALHAAYATDAKVQGHTCHALAAAADILPAPARARVLAAALAGLGAHCPRSDAVVNCAFLISLLTQSAEEIAHQDAGMQARATRVLVDAMRGHPANEKMCGAACATLLMWCLHGPHAPTAVAAGVLESVLGVLRVHSAGPERAHACTTAAFKLLVTLVEQSDDAMRRAIRAGALQLELACIAPDDRAAMRAELRDAVQAADARAEAAAAELLAEESAERAGVGGSSRKKKSKKKAASGKPAEAAGSAGMQQQADAAGAEAEAADNAATANAAGQEKAAAASSQPSALAARRRRRAATKAARRAGAAAVNSSGGDVDAAASQSDEEDAGSVGAPGQPEPPAACDAAGADDACDADAAAEAEAPPPASAELLESLFPWMRVDDGPRVQGDVAAPAAAAAAAQLAHLPTPAAAPQMQQQLPPLPAWLAVPAAAQQPAMAHVAPAPAVNEAPAAPAAALAAAEAHVAQLEAELDATKCVVCLHAARCVALLPCKHQPLCGSPDCFAMLGAPPRCPLCREGVADTLQLFV